MDLLVHCVRQANPAGTGKGFEACGNVDSITVDVLVVGNNHVAEIDTDAELQMPLVRLSFI